MYIIIGTYMYVRSLVINRFSRENDDPLISIDKVLFTLSCHRKSISHKGQIISWFELSVSSCHNNAHMYM